MVKPGEVQSPGGGGGQGDTCRDRGLALIHPREA